MVGLPQGIQLHPFQDKRYLAYRRNINIHVVVVPVVIAPFVRINNIRYQLGQSRR